MQTLKAALVITIALTQAATAQARNCAAREVAIDTLATKYGEARQSIGLSAGGAIVEVFASIETGTWTITATSPDGVTCLMASGRGFDRPNEEMTEGE